jgi:hypothetical protein
MDSLIDPLAAQLPRETQIQAARLAQDGFAHAFRLTLETPAAERQPAIISAVKKLNDWIIERNPPGDANDDAQPALRAAMLLSGLDQWGLAYTQVFGAAAMAGLSELVGGLRVSAPDATEMIQRINDDQAAALSFKSELRKAIHLALWHSMIEDAQQESATATLQQLGGMMLRLVESMPDLGWIIVAHTLADIQIRCLAHQLATSGLAQEMTQALFGALNQQLPADQRSKIMAGATQTVIAWQQSTRNTTSH